jgi:PAS domain S-box-containing protein
LILYYGIVAYMLNSIHEIAARLIWSGKNKTRPAYIRYGIPLILIVLATLVKMQFNASMGGRNPYILYFGIVSLTAVVCGLGPALFSTFITALVADYYFIYPYHIIELGHNDIISTAIYLFECCWLIFLSAIVRMAYQRVRQNQLLFQAMIEKSSEVILLTDRDYNRLYCSPGIEKLTGYTAGEFVKMKSMSLAHPEEVPILRERLEQLLNQPGENITFTRRVQHKDGNWLWIESTVTNLLDDESIKSMVYNYHDVTHRVLLEQKKDDFISIASHELKTPLTSLKTSLQLMDRMKEDPKADRMPKLIAQANRSMDKITELVNELLNVTRIKQGQLQLNKSIFKIYALLENCCNHLNMAGKHEVIIEGDRNVEVRADQNRVEQVIVNFVNNAVKYAPFSEEIFINVHREGDKVKVSVRDTGPGIAEDKQPHIFDRYYRADYGLKQGQGLGLGLFISAGIIKRHGGQIGVDSELGKGSTFWFTLPLGMEAAKSQDFKSQTGDIAFP